MTFGVQCDEDTSFAILDRALEGGVDFIDTADVYPLGGDHTTAGRTEEIVGKWMASRGVRDQVLLATKCAGRMGPGPNDGGLSRYHVQRAVEASLRRLGTDVIDLYQTHAFDPHTPVEETLGALDDLVRAGTVRYVGCSNYPAWRLGDALAASARLGTARYETLQPRYNLLYRDIETEVLPLCEAERLGVIVYNPIAGGMLSGKHRRDAEPEAGTRFTLGSAAGRYRQRYWHEEVFDVVDRLAAAAAERGVALASVAVAWSLRHPAVTSAIVGASRPEQLDATLAGADLELDDDLVALCDSAWWQLPRQPVQEGYR